MFSIIKNIYRKRCLRRKRTSQIDSYYSNIYKIKLTHSTLDGSFGPALVFKKDDCRGLNLELSLDMERLYDLNYGLKETLIYIRKYMYKKRDSKGNRLYVLRVYRWER